MFRKINSAYSKIKQIYLDGNNRWITDNYYLISRNFDALKKSRTIINKKSQLLEVCEKYCKRYSFSLDMEKLCGYFSVRSKNYGYEELSSVPLFLAAAAILEIARAKNCGPAIELLRKLGSEDFDDFFERVSPAERLLESEFSDEYAKMDNATKHAYRRRLAKIAEKKGVSYNEEAARLVKLSHEQKKHVGFFLFPQKKVKVSFFVCEAAIFGFLMWMCAYFCGAYSLLALLPLYRAAQIITDFAFSILARAEKVGNFNADPVFRLEPEYAKEKTLVLITTLLFGGEKDDAIFNRLEKFYLANRQDNLTFGVLGDFKDSPDKERTEDKIIISNAHEAISKLNTKYNGQFVLLARRRIKNADGLYGGRERKRGAVAEAVQFIAGEETTIEYFEGDKKRLEGTRYILTLDADTNLPISAVSELLCAAMHPLARPVVKNGRVVSGYAMFQPTIAVSLESASRSGFSQLIGGNGGVDAYQSAAYDKYQSVLGEGVFCGKGLFDVACYHDLVIPQVPEGFVLSHDLPEGAILRTRLVSDVTLSDSAPKSVLSFFSRASRWIRGDVQNTLLLRSLPSPNGRYMIVQNLINALLPAAQFLGIIVAFLTSVFGSLGTATSGVLLMFLLSCTLLPPVLGILGTPSRVFNRPKRRYFSRITHSVKRDIARLAFELSAIAFSGQISATAAIRSLYRMFVSKKKLLEWVTAGESDRSGKGGFEPYASRMLPSAILGMAVFLFAPFWGMKLAGLLWFAFPSIAYLVSKPKPKKRKLLAAVEREYLIKQAAAMWSFFAQNVNDETNYLPPDNVQYEPVSARADRTSPTNIGLYLLSCLAATDFGFIDSSELESRLKKTLKTIKKLEKWHGHLYNWYETDTLSVIGGRYVSSVDSGNFVTCVCALREGLKEYGLDSLSSEFALLEEKADFSVFYNKKRALFSLGWDGNAEKLSDICYDLYMSEARTTSYYAVAKGIVPKKHWSKLSRTLISNGGYIGLASWTGTAFEYFMPPLLLPVYDNSFEYEALNFAFEMQRKKTAGSPGVWGLSESAFFSFDSEMYYQYKAFGVQKLGLKRYLTDEPVVSPYSSFLMLRMNPKACIKNLRTLEDYGMLGEHGLYEACDFTPTRVSGFAAVKSYMAHHVGMSMAAAANACFADVFVRRFLRNPSMAAAYELLQEKIPDVSIYKDIAPEAKPVAPPLRKRGDGEQGRYSLTAPSLRLIYSGRQTMLVGDLGHVQMRYGKTILNECKFDLLCESGFEVSLSGKKFVPSGDDTESSVSFAIEEKDGAVSHIRSSKEFSGRARYSVKDRCFVIETLAGQRESHRASLSFPVALADERAFLAHPAFSKLSVSAEYLKDEKIILFSRKVRKKSRPLYLAVALSDIDTKFMFDTRLTDITEHDAPPLNRTGATVNPYCRILTELVPGGRVRFLLSCGQSKEEALSAIRQGRNSKRKEKARQVIPPLTARVLGAAYFGSATESVKGDVQTLWRYGISGDYPILLADTNDESSIYECLLIFRTLSLASLRCELAIVVREADKYARESRRGAMKAISLVHCEGFIGRRGGIFIIDYDDFVKDENRNDYDYLVANSIDLLDLPEDEPAEAGLPKIITKVSCLRNDTATEKDEYLRVSGGYFSADGCFTVQKDKKIPLEWSYITANRSFGSVQTQNSLGFTYFLNSSKNKLTQFSNNPYSPNDGERLLMFLGGKAYDLCAISSEFILGRSKCTWRGCVENINFEIELFVCEKLPIKLIKVKHSGSTEVNLALVLKPNGGRLSEIFVDDGFVLFRNLRRERVFGFVGAVPAEGSGVRCETDMLSLFGNSTGRKDCAAVICSGKEALFFVGGAPNTYAARRLKSMVNPIFAKEQSERVERSYVEMLPPEKDNMPPEFALLYRHFLPYQTTISRFYARGAYYQTGGAYGYRDQLQDCLLLVKTKPELVRTHILRCCAHQYTDGSVQHWWHPPREGVKTRCSDDFLWLPFVTAEYVRVTGDIGLLEKETRFLESPPLRENENERYEIASVSDERASVYEHCIRALEHGVNFGSHGLPLMGSCDWNDGFSELGINRRGESVFTAWLFIGAVKAFSNLMQSKGDEETTERLKNCAESVLGAIESYCFDGDRYLRAFDDDGEPLGTAGSEEAELDILPQCLPAIFGGADEQRLNIALDMAYSLCFDRSMRIMKLFTPPFENSKRRVGYIQSYVPGIRENGGQYTHAAVWMALGLLRAGKRDKAEELTRALNPILRCQNPFLAKAYKIEPYVIAADIYSNPDHPGRGGWSWYTGASAWYWRLLDELFKDK